MKTVTLLYTCDSNHSQESKELVGVFAKKSVAISAIKDRANREYEVISEDDLYNLERINQTQNYMRMGEFILEDWEINKII